MQLKFSGGEHKMSSFAGLILSFAECQKAVR
jgi:hypothetical protein